MRFSRVTDVNMMEYSEAERRVEKYSSLIERQRVLIKQLEKYGADVTSAKIIFDSLSVSLSLSLHDRHRVRCHVDSGQLKGAFTAPETADFTNNNEAEPESVLTNMPCAATQLTVVQMSDHEGAVADLPSMHYVDREMTCARCGDALSAPKWSEFLGAHRIVNLWSCTECGYSFVETLSEYGYSEHAAA
jgi:hypothetical protein